MPHRPDDPEMVALRASAIAANEHTAIMTDLTNHQVLIVARRDLDIRKTVIAVPLALFVGVAGVILQGVAAPLLDAAAQGERALKDAKASPKPPGIKS